MKTSFLKHVTIKFLFITIAFVFTANITNAQKDKVRMAFIGNSITAGVYDYGKSDLQVSYATQFGEMMETVFGDTLEIYNAGVSGRTMTKNGPAPIWKESVFKNALAWAPDICLIALGTNDSKPSLYSLVQSEFYNDYQAMIDTFRYYNPNTAFIVCLPPPILDGHPYSSGNPHNDTLLLNYTIPLMDSVAKVNGTFLVDFHTPFVDSVGYFTDKLHPNIEGHKKMAKILFDQFLEEDIFHSALNTFVPEKFGMSVEANSDAYKSGDPVVLISKYIDQRGDGINEAVSDLTWSITAGEGELGEKTDTSVVFIPQAKGSAKIEVTDGEFTEEILLRVSSITSIHNVIKQDGIHVFPNPVRSEINFKVSENVSEEVIVNIFDQQGKQLLEENFNQVKNGETLVLNTSKLSAGTYIYKVALGKGSSTGQFTKL